MGFPIPLKFTVAVRWIEAGKKQSEQRRLQLSRKDRTQLRKVWISSIQPYKQVMRMLESGM
jgi:hypothetical protein